MANGSDERDLPSPTNDTSLVDGDSIDNSEELAQTRGRTIDRTKPMDPATLGSIIKRPPSEDVIIDSISQQLHMRESASGLAATLTAVSRLPKETQLAQIDLEAKRQDHDFELEKQRIANEAQEANAERAHELAKLDRRLAHRETDDRRRYRFAAAVVTAAIGTAIVSLVMHEIAIATHLFTALVSAGLAYLGGKSAGSSQARRQMQLRESQNSRSDDDE